MRLISGFVLEIGEAAVISIEGLKLFSHVSHKLGRILLKYSRDFCLIALVVDRANQLIHRNPRVVYVNNGLGLGKTLFAQTAVSADFANENVQL